MIFASGSLLSGESAAAASPNTNVTAARMPAVGVQKSRRGVLITPPLIAPKWTGRRYPRRRVDQTQRGRGHGSRPSLAPGIGSRPMATIREITFELFREHGMTTIFGNPGSTELPMLAEFPEDFR